MSAPGTIAGLLAAAARRHGAAPALELRDATGAARFWSYDGLLREVRGLAAELHRLGVRRGSRVGLIGDNGPEWTIGYLAIVQTGATAVPLDPAEDNEPRLRASGADGVLVGRLLARPGEPGPPRAPEVPPGLFRIDLLSDVPRGLAPSPELPGDSPTRPDDVASLLFTSGTTDAPRAVPLTHRSLLAECRALAELTPLGRDDRTLALVPLHHVLGFNTGLMLSLWSGMPVGFLPRMDREALLESLRLYRPTAVCAVPAVWQAVRTGIESDLRRRPALARAWFRLARSVGTYRRGAARRLLAPVHRAFGGRLHTLVTSGAPFAAGDVEFWNSLGFEVLHAYGLTETSGAVTCTRPGDPPTAGVGRPLRGVELRLGERGRDGAGEIAVRGAVVMQGYEGGDAGADGASTRFRDGWLWTGDLGRLDERGNLQLAGRLREVIVRRGGETLDPEPIERHLAHAAHVKEVAVVGMGPPGDERPVAVIVPDETAMARAGILDVFGTVRYAVLSRVALLPPAQRPADYRIVPSPLPRTPTRKLRRVEIRRRVERGDYGWGPEAMATRERPSVRAVEALGGDGIADAVARELARVLRPGAPAPGPDSSLGPDLGLDSMDRINLVCRLESALGRRLDDRAIQATYVRDLVDQVRRAAPGRGQRPFDLLGAEQGGEDGILADAQRIVRRLRWPRRLLLAGFGALGRAAFDIRIEGLSHLPRRGPFMLCANHQSYLDPYFLIPALPREFRERLWIVAVEWLFRGPISRAYLYTARTLPMDNLGRFLPGLRMAARILERGEGLLIFPEGMRSFDGRVGPWRPGAGLVALRSGVPVVPVAMAGVYQILPPGRWLPGLRAPHGGRRQVRISIGEPVRPSPPESDAAAADAAQRLVDDLRERVLSLMASFPEQIRPETGKEAPRAKAVAQGPL